MRARILFVDDDLSICELLGEILTIIGYDASCLQSCTGCMAFIAEEPPPDLVLLDLHLPDGSGWSLYRAMRAAPAWARIPVVIVTGLLLEAEIPPEARWKLGELTILQKPFSIKRLRQTIDENLMASRTRVLTRCAV